MSLDKAFITITGFLLIGFIYWFFFGEKKDIADASSGRMDIVVDGGYKPRTIRVSKGDTVTLNITRKDPNSCLEEIVIPDLKIKKYLPLNKKVEISFTPEKSGEYRFQCGMNMYHGKLIVE